MGRNIRKSLVVGALMASLAPALAAAQTGAELSGQTVDILFSDGTENSVYFAENGQATIYGPDGQSVYGTWSVADGQLCLTASDATECFAYNRSFVAGQAVAMSSSCNTNAMFTARAVAAPATSEPEMMGERG